MSTRFYFDEQNNCSRNTKLPEVNRAAFGAAKPMPADFGVKPEKDGGVYIKGISEDVQVSWMPGATATGKPKMLGNKQLFVLSFKDHRTEAYLAHPLEAVEYVKRHLNAVSRKKVATDVAYISWVTEDGSEIMAAKVTQTRTKHYGVIGGNKQK